MKFRRFVVLVTTLAYLASAQPGLRAQVPVTPTTGQGISGKVLKSDRTTVVPDQGVQLRSIDKGTIVGKTVTDANGAFSFAVTEPGLYVAEAVKKSGGVQAVGEPVTFVNSPILTNVILPSSKEELILLTLLGAAAGAGFAARVVSNNGSVSPER